MLSRSHSPAGTTWAWRGRLLAGVLVTLTTVGGVRAVDASEWSTRQTLAVDRTGVIKLAVPPSTLDAARPGLPDLRLLDPTGAEVSYVLERAAPIVPAATAVPRSFRVSLLEASTQLLIETGTPGPLAWVALATPAVTFLKGARVEISSDGLGWETIETGAPLFRQFGAEQLRVDLGRRSATQLRITVDDSRSARVPFTGAGLALAVETQPAPTVPLDGVRLARREEFEGQTVLTVDLASRHIALASIEIETSEPLFARQASVVVRELRGEAAIERTVASATIYRTAVDGLPPRAQLRIPLDFALPSRELLLHVANGDSPPLAIEGVRVLQRPIWIVFRAGQPGDYTLLTGNPDVPAPRYDLSMLATSFRDTAPLSLAPGPIEANPSYRRRDGLADVPLLGGPLNPQGWRYRKAVRLQNAGVQELDLDLDVLAHAQGGFADLRLVRAGAQIPYLMERPGLSRPLALMANLANDSQRPRVSRWEVRLPRAGLPLNQFTLTSAMPLFQRRVRLFEKVADERIGSYERTLAEADWSKSPGNDRPLVIVITAPPLTETLWIETDNGDNPALTLASVRASYPVVRLLFRTEAAPLELYYGNREAVAPRYDLTLVAGQILTAGKNVATLGAEEGGSGQNWTGQILSGTRAGIIFWSALALVVVALLTVVAKLLPKPPAQ